MGIWQWIASNPDDAMSILIAILGLFGVRRWRSAARESTVSEVDRWAATAASAIVVGIKAGQISKSDPMVDLLDAFMRRFRMLALAANVRVSPAHEARALAIAHETLVEAGQKMLIDQAAVLKAAVDEAAERLAKLPRVP